MRAYLIDPALKTVTEIEHNGNYKQIYEFIEAPLFTVLNINDQGDAVYIDDEGLLNNPRYFFILNGYNQPLAGKGLVLGVDSEGDSCDPQITLDELKSRISFAELEIIGWTDTIERDDVEIMPGIRGFSIIAPQPIFGPAKPIK